MDLINDLGTDLAVAFLVEQRFRQKIDDVEALALIDRVRKLLESSSATASVSLPESSGEDSQTLAAH